jgi:hypothetical protein
VRVRLDCTGAPRVLATRASIEAKTNREKIWGWQPVDSGDVGCGRSLLLAWDVPPDQEEPWRRFLQELSDPRHEEFARSRRQLGISAELVWLAPKPSGGGIAIVYLQADNPERALGELVASNAPFDSWRGMEMRRYLGMDLTWLARVASGELLFAWRDDDPGEREAPEEDRGWRESM